MPSAAGAAADSDVLCVAAEAAPLQSKGNKSEALQSEALQTFQTAVQIKSTFKSQDQRLFYRLFYPCFDGVAKLVQAACEEVVCAFDQNEFFRLGRGRD